MRDRKTGVQRFIQLQVRKLKPRLLKMLTIKLSELQMTSRLLAMVQVAIIKQELPTT